MISMSFLENLLDGIEVVWTPLGDMADIYGGLTGKNRSDFGAGNAKYISYKNIYANMELDVDSVESVTVLPGESQREVKYGDVLFTGSSETADEAGMSSAVTRPLEGPIFLNSFSFAVRFNKGIPLLPEFSKHLFRTNFMRQEIAKTASGVTRFNVSKERFRKIQVPVPCPNDPEKSLAIQAEIARILDTFTHLIAELTAELAARKKQYRYYRDQLLAFAGTEVEWKPLGEVGKFFRGKRFTKADYVENGISVIHYGEIYTRYGVWTDYALSRVRSSMAGTLRYAKPGDVVIAGVGETVEDVGKAVAWMGNEDVAFHDDSYAFRHSMNPKFISYAMKTTSFIAEKAKHVSRGKVNRLIIEGVAKVSVPIPFPNDTEKSLAEQARIVAVLDKFDALTSCTKEGLPREIALRQRQYEHYRELLLSFPKREKKVA
jgi:type I restriction enzyme S subunit